MRRTDEIWPGLLSARDTDRARLLAEALILGNVIGFIGAGLSIASGYPSWGKLLDRLHELLEGTRFPKSAVSGRHPGRQRPDKSLLKHSDMLWRAEEYKLLTPPTADFNLLIGQAIGSFNRTNSRSSPVARDVVSLPFRHFLTTNYDECLQMAARKVGVQPKPNTYCWPDPDPGCGEPLVQVSDPRGRAIIHLHGTYANPKSLILSDSDYAKFYLWTDRNAKQLFTIFATYQLCFIGFSMTDPHILRVLEQAQACRGSGEPRHWAILGDPGDSERFVLTRMLERRFGVAPIYYKVSGRSHAREAFRHFPIAIRSLVAATQAGAKRGVSTESSHPSPVAAFPRPLRAVKDSDDPNRGRFGGLAERDGLVLKAVVKSAPEDPEWFDIELSVKASRRNGRPLREGTRVTFHMHPTFPTAKYVRRAHRGAVRLRRYAWGAFTVGVEVSGRTCLELDLSREEEAPKSFRAR